MAEYRRWISYIYTYENGEKRQNAGYVRSELRNGQVRITLYMDTKPEKEELYVCAYRVHGEQSEGIQLGRLQLCTGKEEFRIEQEAECFTEGEWKFKQVIQNGGLLIFPKKAVGQAEYFAAAWGTGNLNGEQAEQIMKVLREGTDKRGTVEEKEEEPKEEITEEKRKETKNEEPKREEEKREETKNEEPKREEEKREETKNEELKRGKEKREETKNEELKREEEKREETKNEESKEEENVPEMTGRVLWSAEVQPSEEMLGHITEEKLQSQREPVAVRNACCAGDRSMRPFCCLEAMYPFEDGEFDRSVRMEPQDIGMLPRSMWKYAGNSFLLHGFYTYHHLLLTRKRKKEGDCCYLLVPGTYGGREAHMAQMFGFRQFKSLKRKQLENGDFGYWYLEVPKE